VRFTLQYPVVDHLLTASGVATIARTADELGFDALAFTEHPAPSRKWMDAGGHATLDPFAALAFCAAVTDRIRLMTYLLVVPYHSPFAAAKALTTLDRLSSGRVTVVAGAGYLRSEFHALGVPFEERNEIFDEALRLMRQLWTTDTVHHDGDHFSALGVTHQPRPLLPDGPPILIGGNSRRARERAAEHQGWSPVLSDEAVATVRERTTRTPGLVSIGQLAEQARQVREAAGGRTLTIQAQTPQSGILLEEKPSFAHHVEHLAELAAAGVDSFVVHAPGSTVSEVVDSLQRYAGHVELSA